MRDPENKRFVKLGITGVAVVAASLLCFFLLYKLGNIVDGFRLVMSILMPFVYGAVLAYILAPICGRLERLLRRLMPKAKGVPAIAIVLALALAVLVIWALIMLVFPQVWASIVSIAAAIPGELEQANKWLHDLLTSRPELQLYWDEFSQRITDKINGWVKTDLLTTVSNTAIMLGSQLVVFFTVMKNLFIGMLISIYFLASRKQFAAQAKLLLYGALPQKAAVLVDEEVRYADRMFNGFLMGKLLDSAIIGLLCFAGTTLMGFQSAALVSVIVGVTNIIPFFGPFIGAVPCAILLLLENPMHCLYFILFIIVLQQLDGNLIGPKILGNSTGLSSFWVLFAILLFGGLWGVVGMIVGVPLFAVIYDVVRKLTWYGLGRHGKLELAEEYTAGFHPEPAPKEPKKRSKKSPPQTGNEESKDK